MLIVAKRLVEKELVKQKQTNFIATIIEVGDRFHYISRWVYKLTLLDIGV